MGEGYISSPLCRYRSGPGYFLFEIRHRTLADSYSSAGNCQLYSEDIRNQVRSSSLYSIVRREWRAVSWICHLLSFANSYRESRLANRRSARYCNHLVALYKTGLFGASGDDAAVRRLRKVQF